MIYETKLRPNNSRHLNKSLQQRYAMNEQEKRVLQILGKKERILQIDNGTFATLVLQSTAAWEERIKNFNHVWNN